MQAPTPPPVQAGQVDTRSPSPESDDMGFSEFEEVDEPLLLCLTREDYWEILEPYTADPSDGLAEDYSEDTFQVQFYALDHVSDADWLRSGVVLAFIQRYGMQVTGLWIENLFFEELVHLMDFIALFPTINSLEIFYCNWLAIGNLDQFDTLVKSSALVSLSVDNCEPDSTALAGWLARAPSLEVRQMNWAFTLGDPDIASHTALLQRTGNHLTHLNLDVIFLVNLTYAAGAVVGPETFLDLSKNNKLEWLCITGPIIFDSIPSNLLQVSVASVNSKVLKTIEYHINPSTVQDLDTLTFDLLERLLLDSGSFPALEMVDFQIHTRYGRKPLATFDQLEAALLGKLPRLVMLGMLVVTRAQE